MTTRDPLPRLVLIADRFTDPARAERIAALVDAGIRWVQLRDHEAEVTVFQRAAAALVERLRGAVPVVRIAVNTRIDVAEALEVDLHVGVRGPTAAEARRRLGHGRVIGYSAHGLEDAVKAHRAGVDYCLLSPIFPTDSKPGHPGRGLHWLADVCTALPELPVVALGGLTPERVQPCLRAGAYGVAVLSGLMNAADPRAAVHAYLASINAYLNDPI